MTAKANPIIPPHKHAVIYCRVSSKSQEEEGHGLESQETRCREHARLKGYTVEAVFPGHHHRGRRLHEASGHGGTAVLSRCSA